MFQNIKILALLCSSAVLLAGCQMSALGPLASLPLRTDFLTEEPVHLAEINYAAADFIAGNAHHNLKKSSTSIKVGNLHDAQNKDIVTSFGRLIPEQVGTRFSQLGYIVNLDNIPTYEGEIKPIAGKPSVLITGSYMDLRDEVEVNLRLVHLKNGQIIGSHDYTIPKNRMVDDMLEPVVHMIRQ